MFESSRDRQIFQPNLDRRAIARAGSRPVDSRKNESLRAQRRTFYRTVPNTSSEPIFVFRPHARGSMPPRRQLDYPSS
jgi:hypothetical protein